MWFPVDLEETAQEYTFVADVPGLGKNDIKVPLLSCQVVSRGSSLSSAVPLYSCLLQSGSLTDILRKLPACFAQVQVNKDRELSISGERRQHSSTASSGSGISNDSEGQGSDSSKASPSKMQRKRQERRFGSFRRTWNLPEDADVSQIRASVDQGVLTLVISRVQPVEPEVTEITIN